MSKQDKLENPALKLDNRIQEVRELKGLSLRELADKSGKLHQQISRHEKGHRKVSVDFMEAIAQALNCPFTDLLPGRLIYHIPLDQQELLGLYRDLSEPKRMLVLQMVRAVSEP